MQLTDHPDHVVRHVPACCGRCGRDLAGARETGMERRQATEIPPVKAEVTGHQLIERECGGLRDADQGPGTAGSGCPGAVRAAGRRAGDVPVARAVPVQGPGLSGDGGHVRLRAVAGARWPR
jgi:hypothetical protein